MASWKENKVVAIVSGAIFILAVVAFVLAIQPKKTKTCLISKGTGEVLEMALAANPQYPMKNPKTGAADLYPALKVKCQKCGWTGYIISYFEPGKPGEGKCPKCNADRKYLLTTS